ncbi:hypothetical protein ACFLZN_02165 [Nanoarchaeota archaeon]
MKNKYLIIPSYILDIIFFVLLGVLHLEILTKVSDHLFEITKIMEEQTKNLIENELIYFESNLLTDPAFTQHYHAILGYLALFVLLAFLLFVIFQGLNFYLAHRMVHNVKFKEFAWKFPLYSLIAFILSALVMLLIATTSELFSGLPLTGITEITIIMAAALAIILYFLTVAVTKLKLKQSLILSVKHFYPLFLYYIIPVMIWICLMYIGGWLFTLSWLALLFFVLLVIIPYLTAFRLFFITKLKSFHPVRKTSEKKEEHK